MSINYDKLKQLKALKRNVGKGLQYLIGEAYRILGNPVILYDADWKILSYPEDIVSDDPIWNNHIDGTISRNIEIFLNEGFIDIMVRPDKVVLLQSEKIKYDRLFGKIYDNEKNILAGISVVASCKPFQDDDFYAAEAICRILSGEILKIPYYQGYARAKMEACINMMIAKEIEGTINRLYASRYVEMIYAGLKEYLYLAVADISECDAAHAKPDHYKDLFKRILPAFKYSVYSGYIVIIMSAGEKSADPKRSFSRLGRLIKQDNIKVGISGRFENLFELPKRYHEAVGALEKGLQYGGGRNVFSYEKNKT